jgi:hypothetical protein
MKHALVFSGFSLYCFLLWLFQKANMALFGITIAVWLAFMIYSALSHTPSHLNTRKGYSKDGDPDRQPARFQSHRTQARAVSHDRLRLAKLSR